MLSNKNWCRESRGNGKGRVRIASSESLAAAVKCLSLHYRVSLDCMQRSHVKHQMAENMTNPIPTNVVVQAQVLVKTWL